MFRKILLSSIAATSVVSLVEPAIAQETDAGVAGDDIIVTAQKRDERLQDVPIAVSAFTEEFRETAGILSTQDIMNFTPAVSYSATADRVAIRGIGRQTNQSGTDPGVAVYQDGFYVPGLSGVGDTTLGVARVEVLRGPQGTLYGRNSIGGAINVISRRPGDELEREVRVGYNDYNRLTLEGRVAGPLTETLGASMRLINVNQDDGYFTNVAGGTDEGGVVDSFGSDVQFTWDPTSRLSGWLRWNFNEYNNNERADNMVSPYDSRYLLGNAPTPTWAVSANSNPGLADPRQFQANRASTQDLDANHQITTEWNYGFDGVNVRYIAGYLQYDLQTTFDGDRTARTSAFQYPVNFGWSVTDLGNPILQPNTVIDGPFDSIRGNATFDGVTVPVAGDTLVDTFENKDALSHEINLSSTGAGPLQWLFGLYHYEETVATGLGVSSPNDVGFTQVQSPALSPAIAAFAGLTVDSLGYLSSLTPLLGAPNPNADAYRYATRLDTQSSAIFGQLDYDFSDTLHATLGLRYTHDEKQGYETQRVVAWWPYGVAQGALIDLDGAGPGPAFPNPAPFVVNIGYDLGVSVSCPLTLDCGPDPLNPLAGAAQRRVEDSWNMTTGTAGLQWTPSDDTLVYLTYSRGAKAGGFNLGSFAVAPVDVETVDAIEAGLKKDFGRSIRLNASIFHYTYEGMQLASFTSPAPGVSLPVLVNMGEVESNGAELEARWIATDNLTISANYSYLHAEITDGCCFIDDANPYGLLYGALANQVGPPDASFNIRQSVDGNAVPYSPEHKAAVNLAYRINFAPGELALSATANYRSDAYYTIFNTPDYLIEGDATLDLRAVWRDAQDRYTLIGSIANVTDEQVAQSFSTTSPTASRQQTLGLQPPRIFSVELQYRF